MPRGRGEEFLDDLALILARDDVENVQCGVERGQGERQAKGRSGLDAHGNDPARFFVEGGRTGKERSGVTLRPDSKQNQIESRAFGAEMGAQRCFVVAGGFFRIGEGGGHRMDVGGRDGERIDERLAGHLAVAQRVGGKDVALVAPEKMRSGPIDSVAIFRGEDLVEAAWGVAAGKHKIEAGARGEGGGGDSRTGV